MLALHSTQQDREQYGCQQHIDQIQVPIVVPRCSWFVPRLNTREERYHIAFAELLTAATTPKTVKVTRLIKSAYSFLRSSVRN